MPIVWPKEKTATSEVAQTKATPDKISLLVAELRSELEKVGHDAKSSVQKALSFVESAFKPK